MLLKDIASVKGGKRLPKTDQLVSYKTNHPYIRIRDMYQSYPLQLNDDFEYITDDTYEKIKRYTVEQGDVILAVVGNTIGLVSLIGESLDGANLTENCNKIVDLQQYDNKFLYYYLTSKQGQEEIKKGIIGSSQPKLPIYNIEKFEIPEISLDSQKKIVSVLETIDKKININEKINNNLEQQAQAIFKSWFIDFKPFQGKQPADWYISTLGEISTMGAGGDKPKIVSPVKTEDCLYPIYSNGISAEGLYGYTDKARIFDESVTVSARGTIGFVCLRHIPYVPIVRLVTLVPNTEQITAKYLYLWLKNLHITGTGTTQQQLTVPDFQKTKILVPTVETVTSFTSIINPLYEKIWANQVENEKLASMRDTLLPKLMSGELDVSNIDL